MSNQAHTIDIIFTGTSTELDNSVNHLNSTLAGLGHEVIEVEKDFRKVNSKLREHRKHLLDMGVSGDKLAESMRDYAATLKGSIKVTAKLGNTAINSAEGIAVLNNTVSYHGAILDGVNVKTKELGKSQRLQLGNVFKYSVLYGGMAAALYKVDQAMSSIIERGMELESTKAVFASAFGGTQEAARELNFLTGVADRYSLSISNLRVQYRQFATSATLSGATMKETRAIFENMSKAARGLQLSNDDLGGAFKAITQIFSKGTVMAEELTGQLGERLPGALAIMAKSVGVSTAKLRKMMEQGKLTSDAMAGFARAYAQTISSEGLEKSLDSVQAKAIDLTNTWDKFATTTFNKTSPALKAILEDLTSITEGLNDLVDAGAIEALTTSLKVLGGVIEALVLRKFFLFVNATYDSMAALGQFSGASTKAGQAVNGLKKKMTGLIGTFGKTGLIGVIASVVTALYLYRNDLEDLIMNTDKYSEAAIEQRKALKRVELALKDVAIATREQIQANEDYLASQGKKAKADLLASQRNVRLAKEELNAFRETAAFKESLANSIKDGGRSQAAIEASAHYAQLVTALGKARNTLKRNTLAAQEFEAQEKKMIAASKERLKQIAINDKYERQGLGMTLKMRERLAEQDDLLEAKEAARWAKEQDRLKRQRLQAQGNAEEAYKLTEAYKKLSPEHQKLALAEFRATEAAKAHKEALKGTKPHITATEKEVIKLEKAFRAELNSLSLATQKLSGSEESHYRLGLAMKGLKKKQIDLLVVEWKRYKAAEKIAKQNKKRLADRKKDLKLLDKLRASNAKRIEGITGQIEPLRNLTEEENKEYEALRRKEIADKRDAKNRKAYTTLINKQSDELFNLRDKLGLVTEAEKKKAFVEKYGTKVSYEAYQLKKSSIEQYKEETEQVKRLTDAMTSMIDKLIPGFSKLGKAADKISESLSNVLQGKKGAGADLLANIDKAISPNKGGGFMGALGNAQNAYNIAGQLGGSKNAQLGSAIGSLAAAMWGLPPSMGAVFGGFIGQLTTLLHKKASIRFDQNIIASDGEGVYDRPGVSRTTDFGTFGVSDLTKRYGRASSEFKRAVDQMLDQAVTTDGLISKLMSQSQRDKAKGYLEEAGQKYNNGIQYGNNEADIKHFLESRLNAQIKALDVSLQALIPSTASYTEKLLILEEITKAAEEWAIPLQNLGFNLGRTKDSITAAAYGLSKAAGGAEALSAKYSNFVSKFYSPWEQLAKRQEIASAQVSQFNEELYKETGIRITSSQELRTYIDNLVKSGAAQTEAGQKAINTALDIVDSFDELDKVNEAQDAYIQKQKDDAKKKADREKEKARKEAEDRNKAHENALKDAQLHREKLERERKELEERNRVNKLLYSSNLEAVKGLEKLAGGIDALVQTTNDYAKNVFTEEEQKALALAKAGQRIKKIAETLNIDPVLLSTRAGIRKAVDELAAQGDSLTEAQKKALLELMKASSDAVTLEDAGITATEAIRKLPDQLVEVVGGLNNTIAPIEESTKQMQLAASGIRTVADDVNTLKESSVALFDSLKTSIEGLASGDTGEATTKAAEDLNRYREKLLKTQNDMKVAEEKSRQVLEKVLESNNKLVDLYKEQLKQNDLHNSIQEEG